MRAVLCFLCLIFFPSLFVSSNQERRTLITTIKLLNALGPKACINEVENANSSRFRNLIKKRQEIPEALKISYNSTFEIFKKKVNNCHWHNNAFRDLMEHLNRQIISNTAPVISSELETMVNDFKLLDDFLTTQKFSCCAWEIARHDVLVVMDHFRKRSAQRKIHY